MAVDLGFRMLYDGKFVQFLDRELLLKYESSASISQFS